MLSRSLHLSKVLNYHSLIALCTIGAIYHFLSIRSQFTVRAPFAHTDAQQSEIPKLIWYKLGPNGLSEDARNWTNSCIQNNPTYEARFITDESGDEYVRKAFAFRSDIVDSYLALPVPIYKADFLRYLLLWDQGGIWSDLDVSCKTPIDEWVPPEYQKDAAVVVGWEFDHGWPGQYIRQFASWTMMAKPRSPHFMQVIDDILEKLQEQMAKHHLPSIANATLDIMGDVVDFTGPRRLTRGIIRSLEKQLNQSIDAIGDLKELLQPKLVGDVLVMPGRSFAASSNTYTPEQEALLPKQLVEHHYAGSWKNSKGGEQ
ncbi:hypothetical protein ACJQWK_03077 [Exserohilum turcicum]|uniref:Glycosyltransferase family 32 protein n=1 Tax=Exserohilum turcicum (strain 28A) TaxID=671987 RepID=R0K8G1_EXST2|nr:glycosyltransferase family 32 protein [Exserohilum turcica Et28A]EOA85749.1 glycosyltransferase family 32 protein [Exserohilum turcica Et28A]